MQLTLIEQTANDQRQAATHRIDRFLPLPGLAQLLQVTAAGSGDLLVADVGNESWLAENTEIDHDSAAAMCLYELLNKSKLFALGIESAGDDYGFRLVRHRLTLPDLMILESFDRAHHRLFDRDALDA